MSDEKGTSDSIEVKEMLEELSSDVTKKDIITIMKYDKNRRLTMKPTHGHKQSDDNKSSDDGSSNGEPEDEDTFDVFILNNFSPFSEKENVTDWLDMTDEKFNIFKISRKLRYLAIPLLVKGDAKRAYISNKDKINSYDDFYTFLLTEYSSINHKGQPIHSQSGPQNLIQNKSIEDASIRKNVIFDEKTKLTSNSFELDDSLPHAPVLRSTALPDPGSTCLFGDDPVNRSSIALSQNKFLNSSNLDQTAYAHRRAVVDSLIKNPKTFRGSKDDDVKHWLEDIEQLFDTAQIPENHKLDLVQYSLRGEALRWFKNNKTMFTSWKTFVQGLKEAFLSPFFEEIAFKKLDSYTQGVNQPVRSFYNEVIKLCNEADSSMSDFTKLRNLLNKTKPTLQLEIRKKKPTTTKQFLQYAIEVEELFQLSNIDISDESHKNTTTTPLISSITSSRSINLSTQPDKTVSSTTYPRNNYDYNYKPNNRNNTNPSNVQPFVPTNSNYPTYHQTRQPWQYSNQPFTHQNHNFSSTHNSSKTPYNSHYNPNNFPNNKNHNNYNYNHLQKKTNSKSQPHYNSTNHLPSLLDPLPSPSSFDHCSRCQQAGHQASACSHF